MALLFMDSFDHYTDPSKKGWYGYDGLVTIGAYGRWGTNGLRSEYTNRRTLLLLPGGAKTTVIVGTAFRVSNMGVRTNVVQFIDGVIFHVEVGVNTSGKIEVRRGLNGTLLATGTQTLSPNVFYYVESKVTIDDAAGVVVVRVNGVVDVNLTGADTRNASSASVDRIDLGYNGDGSQVHASYDDLYICDTTGSSPTNDFLGDVRVEALFANGNGNSSVLVGSDGNSTDNYLLVDETVANDDTDYVESSTVGDKDTYAYGNLTTSAGTVAGIQMMPYARKTDAGVRSIASVARLSATEVDSANRTLSASYAYYSDIRETKPGGGAWSISDINSAEFGVKVTE